MIAQYKAFPLRMSKEKQNEEEKIKLKTKPQIKTNSSLDEQTAGSSNHHGSQEGASYTWAVPKRSRQRYSNGGLCVCVRGMYMYGMYMYVV